jgi:hypothetical protein
MNVESPSQINTVVSKKQYLFLQMALVWHSYCSLVVLQAFLIYNYHTLFSVELVAGINQDFLFIFNYWCSCSTG